MNHDTPGTSRVSLRQEISEGICGSCEKLGITQTQAISMFLAQLVKLRAFPFRSSEFSALEEYGVTLAEAEIAEAAMLKEIKSDRKKGRLVAFRSTRGLKNRRETR